VATTYYAAWWNVENLFDYEDSPRRTDKLRRALGKDLKGWTPELRDRKIAQLASTIAAMNSGQGPDLLGVCEVENAWVLERLAEKVSALVPGRRYAVAHADTRDQRGIDVAFLYDDKLLTAPAKERFQHVVMRRTATREIFQVNFKTRRGRTWTVFANHWPSRSGGHYESDGYRAIAGETLSYFHERAMEIHGKTTPVMALGDFNDEPFDESLTRHALSARQRETVIRGTKAPHLWNLTWDVAAREEGTFYFKNQANVLDQVLVNKQMALKTAPIRVQPETVTVESGLPGIAKSRSGTLQPIPFGGMGKPVNEDGYSDHFPISVQVVEAD
jgi:endonuclease/exonuclease/phosphatase family metal-dependent hydrolase